MVVKFSFEDDIQKLLRFVWNLDNNAQYKLWSFRDVF